MKNTKKKGFTIVELVIVIAVIGILSAILIPTFTHLVKNANDTKLQADLRNAYTAYVDAQAEHVGDVGATGGLYSIEDVVFKKGDTYYVYSNGVYSEGNASDASSTRIQYNTDTTNDSPTITYDVNTFNGFEAYVKKV